MKLVNPSRRTQNLSARTADHVCEVGQVGDEHSGPLALTGAQQPEAPKPLTFRFTWIPRKRRGPRRKCRQIYSGYILGIDTPQPMVRKTVQGFSSIRSQC